MLEVQPLKRKFLPADLAILIWDNAKPYAEDLISRPIETMADYQRFLEDSDELDRVLAEESARRYIALSCNTADEAIKKAHDDFLQFIQPEITRYGEQINRRFVESPFSRQVEEDGFAMLLRRSEDSLKLFREENIPLQTEENHKASESDQIKGAMTVTWEGKTLTMPQASDVLRKPDRDGREKIWFQMRARFMQDAEKLDGIYGDLVALRGKIAQNADKANYRDYMFAALGRYDYTAQDCFTFHDAIEQAVVPVVDAMNENRRKALGLDSLRPWDLLVDAHNRPPIKAFENAGDLIAKGIVMLNKVDPLFGDVLALMQRENLLDLDSRPNKRPGGYNYLLQEKNIPFMFGNVTQKPDDVNLLVHEMGHATHDISSGNLRLQGYKSYPMEVAELASMSLELLSHDDWDVFFKDEKERNRAKLEHLQGILEFFPWMAMVDAFQHQVYENPQWTNARRNDAWLALAQRFQGKELDWSGLEIFRPQGWHKQGHIFSVPFYYVEYGIAQLGALQVWRNYKQDKRQALAQYKNALALGYTKSIPEIYETAGIKFDFSAGMLQELMAFVQAEMAALS